MMKMKMIITDVVCLKEETNLGKKRHRHNVNPLIQCRARSLDNIQYCTTDDDDDDDDVCALCDLCTTRNYTPDLIHLCRRRMCALLLN